MVKFSWEEFELGFLHVRCRTWERCSEFLKRAVDNGYTWVNGEEIEPYDSIVDTCRWGENQERSVYAYESRSETDKGLVYTDDKDIGLGYLIDWITDKEESYGVEVVKKPKPKVPQYLRECPNCFSTHLKKIKKMHDYIYKECEDCGCMWRYKNEWMEE